MLVQSTPRLASEMISESKLQRRLAELGQRITFDYADTQELILIGVLKGSVVFLSDLMRQIHVPHTIEFIQASSYGIGARESSGNVQIKLDVSTDIEGKDVLIVEDIIDTGYTLKCLREHLLARRPASLEICTLLDKPSRRVVDVPVKYVGFPIPDEFVVGYGIDADEMYRHLPYIASVSG